MKIFNFVGLPVGFAKAKEMVDNEYTFASRFSAVCTTIANGGLYILEKVDLRQSFIRDSYPYRFSFVGREADRMSVWKVAYLGPSILLKMFWYQENQSLQI